MPRSERADQRGGGAQAYRDPEDAYGQCVCALIDALAGFAELHLPTSARAVGFDKHGGACHQNGLSVRQTLEPGKVGGGPGWIRLRRERFGGFDRLRIPGCTYTDPGIGSVGLTEAQARAAGYNVKIGKFPFLANSKASILGKHDGFVKIVADETYGEILGVHIIGPEAFELISEGVLAMESEATVETLMHTIHAHPTLYEAMGEAFNAVYGLAINA